MKVLKTYGRKFKTSFLEVSNTKRVWSPEVVVLRSPRRNRSEILFDSICQLTSKPPRQPHRLGRYDQDRGLFDITTKHDSDDSGNVSLSPPGKVNHVRRKGRQRNCNTRKKTESVKPCKEEKGRRVNKTARPRKQNGGRPLTKLSLKSKKQQVKKKRSPSLRRKEKPRHHRTSHPSNSTASSASSCEIQRHCFEDNNSLTLNKPRSKERASSAQHSSEGLLKGTKDSVTSVESLSNPTPNWEKDEEWRGLAGKNWFKSSLSDIRCSEVNTREFPADDRVELSLSNANLEHRDLDKVSPIMPKRNEGRRPQSAHASDSSASSFVFPENETDWITTRKKKKGSGYSRRKSGNRMTRLSFEAKEGPISDSGTPWSSTPVIIAAHWSPFLVSTPVSHARVQGAQARRAWFLNCTTQTPRSSLADVTNSVLAHDSLSAQDKASGTTSHKMKTNLKRKLSGMSQFENAPNKIHRCMSQRNTESSGCVELEGRRKCSGKNQSYPSKHKTPRAIEPTPQTEHAVVPCTPPWETIPLKELHVRLQKNIAIAESKSTTTLGASFEQAITSDPKAGSKSESRELSRKGSERSGKHSWQHISLKEPRIVLVDILNVTSAQEYEHLRQHSRLQIRSADGSTTKQQYELGVEGAYQYKQKVQSQEVPSKNGSTNLHFSQCAPAATADVDSEDTTLLPAEDALRKKFQLKEARVILTHLAGKGQSATGLNEEGAKPGDFTSSFLPFNRKQQCSIDGGVWDKCQQLSASFAEAYLSSKASEEDSAKFPSQGNNTQFKLCLGECSESKGTKIFTADAPCSDVLVLELSQMISAAANYTKLKLSATEDEQSPKNVRVGARTRLQARLNRMAVKASTTALNATLTANINVAVRRSGERLVASGRSASSKNESCEPIEQFRAQSVSSFEQCVDTIGLFKDPGLFLETTHCHLVPPPVPAPIVKDKRMQRSYRLSNDAQVNHGLQRHVTAASCNFSQAQGPRSWNDSQTTTTMKRQGRLSMARKSVVPSAVLLDANLGLLGMCNQKEALTFEQALGSKALKSCRKIGEGTYGEVFRIRLRSKTAAIKIVPIEGSFPVNGEKQKTAAQILPEAIISVELSALSGQKSVDRCQNFIEVKRLCYVQDRYHPALMKQWDAFNANKDSENDRPDCFGADQKFLMLEFADGGSSLEDYKVKSATEARSIFLQVTCALAVAENALEFEHRDLHWGNILVAPTDQHSIPCRLAGRDFELDCAGVFVSVIDYTLSRMHKGGAVMFTDVSSEDDLFKGSGDYQFDIYRLMREHNQNDWKSFRPYTNVLWLHYLSRKLLEKRRYPTMTQKQRSALGELQQWNDTLILKCQSSVELFFKCIGYEPNH